MGSKKYFFAKRFADTQKLLIFALLFKSSTERWVSGLNQQFAKLSYGITVPGVRIPLSPPRRFFRQRLPSGSRIFVSVRYGSLLTIADECKNWRLVELLSKKSLSIKEWGITNGASAECSNPPLLNCSVAEKRSYILPKPLLAKGGAYVVTRYRSLR